MFMRRYFILGFVAVLAFNFVNIVEACTWKNIQVDSKGTVKGRYIPCQNPKCPDFQKHCEQIKNADYYVNGKRMTAEEYKEYQRKQYEQLMKDRDGTNNQVPVENRKDSKKNKKTDDTNKKETKKRVPIEKKFADGAKKIFGL